MEQLFTVNQIKKKLLDNDYYIAIQKISESQFDLTFPLRKFKPSYKKQKLSVGVYDNTLIVSHDDRHIEPLSINLPNYAHRTYIKGLLYFGAEKLKYSPYMVLCLDENGDMLDRLDTVILDPNNKDDQKKEIALLEVVNPFLDNIITLEQANIEADKFGVLEEFHLILEGKNVL